MTITQRGTRAFHKRTLAATLFGSLLVCACTGGAGSASDGADVSVANADASAIATVGMRAPAFTLTDVDGNSHTLADYTKRGQMVVLEWYNPDCPIVKRYHAGESRMAASFNQVRDSNVVWLAINSGARGKQGAGRDRNLRSRDEYGVSYPILLDEDGAVGRAYNARNTPHMFVIDEQGVLIYDGAIDDGSVSQYGEVNYVVRAVGEYLGGAELTASKTKPFGCSVKYAD